MYACGMQAITEEVYRLLENQCQLHRVYLPVVFQIYSEMHYDSYITSVIFATAILSVCISV